MIIGDGDVLHDQEMVTGRQATLSPRCEQPFLELQHLCQIWIIGNYLPMDEFGRIMAKCRTDRFATTQQKGGESCEGFVDAIEPYAWRELCDIRSSRFWGRREEVLPWRRASKSALAQKYKSEK